MNYGIITYIIGWVLNFEALFMAPACLVAVVYQEKEGFSLFAVMLLCLVLGV